MNEQFSTSHRVRLDGLQAGSSQATAVERSLRAIARIGPHPRVRVALLEGWVRLSGTVVLARDRWRVEAAVGDAVAPLRVSSQIASTEGHAP